MSTTNCLLWPNRRLIFLSEDCYNASLGRIITVYRSEPILRSESAHDSAPILVRSRKMGWACQSFEPQHEVSAAHASRRSCLDAHYWFDDICIRAARIRARQPD